MKQTLGSFSVFVTFDTHVYVCTKITLLVQSTCVYIYMSSFMYMYMYVILFSATDGVGCMNMQLSDEPNLGRWSVSAVLKVN